MAKAKKKRARLIPDYETDLLAVVDVSHALKQPMNMDTRTRVLEFIVRRELGDHFRITEAKP